MFARQPSLTDVPTATDHLDMADPTNPHAATELAKSHSLQQFGSRSGRDTTTATRAHAPLGHVDRRTAPARSFGPARHAARAAQDDLVYRDLGHVMPPPSAGGLAVHTFHDADSLHSAPVFRSVAAMPPADHAWGGQSPLNDAASLPSKGGLDMPAFGSTPYSFMIAGPSVVLGAKGFAPSHSHTMNPKSSEDQPRSHDLLTSQNQQQQQGGGESIGGYSGPHPSEGLEMPSFGGPSSAAPAMMGQGSTVSGIFLPSQVNDVLPKTSPSDLQTICEPDRFDAVLDPLPSYVEPNATFHLVGMPHELVLTIGMFLINHSILFSYVGGSQVRRSASMNAADNPEHEEEGEPATGCMFEQCSSFLDGRDVLFNVTLYLCETLSDDGRVDCLVEFQRRRGDSVAFAAIYNKARDELRQQFPTERHLLALEKQKQSHEQEQLELGEKDAPCVPEIWSEDMVPAGDLNPKAVPQADQKTLEHLSSMVKSGYLEQQFEGATAVARLSENENNCKRILNHEQSVSGLIDALNEQRDERVQRSAAASVANLVSAQPQHVPRESVNVMAVALIALLLLSTSLEVVRESARALVSLSDLPHEFEPTIVRSYGGVCEKLANTHDAVAEKYRAALLRKIPAMPSF